MKVQRRLGPVRSPPAWLPSARVRCRPVFITSRVPMEATLTSSEVYPPCWFRLWVQILLSTPIHPTPTMTSHLYSPSAVRPPLQRLHAAWMAVGSLHVAQAIRLAHLQQGTTHLTLDPLIHLEMWIPHPLPTHGQLIPARQTLILTPIHLPIRTFWTPHSLSPALIPMWLDTNAGWMAVDLLPAPVRRALLV
jgi:hypothetical protein